MNGGPAFGDEIWEEEYKARGGEGMALPQET